MNHHITVVGLGPGAPSLLTLEAHRVLQEARVVYARTLKHPVLTELASQGKTLVAFDDRYEAAEDFDSLYADITAYLWEASLTEPVVYAVPGNPRVAEETVERLVQRAQASGHPLKLVYGAGCAEAVVNALGIDPLDGLVLADVHALARQNETAHQQLLVFQIDSRLTAAQAKLQLMGRYPDEHPVTLVRGAGTAEGPQITAIQLYRLDQEDWFDHQTTLYVPPLPGSELVGSLEELVAIMARLRSPEGCPWDLKQDHQSLLPYLIEEAYEVLDAVEAQDYALLEEELGDLLLQIVFHSRIAEENGCFEIRDVLRGISGKMIRRHPHVFADGVADTPEEVLVNWEAIKKEEKDELDQHASMDRIPRQLPALMRSFKVQQKAAEVGFDWETVQGALEKVEEEFHELTELLDSGDQDRQEDELGDLLFAVVNVARFLKVSPEQALSRTTEKFMKRFKYVEERSAINGLNMKDCPLEVLDSFWNQAKTLEK